MDTSYLIRIYFAASFLGKTYHGRAGNRATLELKLRSCYGFSAGEFNIAQESTGRPLRDLNLHWWKKTWMCRFFPSVIYCAGVQPNRDCGIQSMPLMFSPARHLSWPARQAIIIWNQVHRKMRPSDTRSTYHTVVNQGRTERRRTKSRAGLITSSRYLLHCLLYCFVLVKMLQCVVNFFMINISALSGQTYEESVRTSLNKPIWFLSLIEIST